MGENIERRQKMSYSLFDNVDSWEEVICRKQRWCQKETWPQIQHIEIHVKNVSALEWWCVQKAGKKVGQNNQSVIFFSEEAPASLFSVQFYSICFNICVLCLGFEKVEVILRQ